jgi:hypothetical protein
MATPCHTPMSRLHSFTDIDTKSKNPTRSVDECADEAFSKKVCTGRMLYTGRKRTGLTKMTSLFDMCMTLLCNHIDDLEEVGGAYYWKA